MCWRSFQQEWNTIKRIFFPTIIFFCGNFYLSPEIVSYWNLFFKVMNIIIAGYICIKSRSERWQIGCDAWNWWWVGNDWCQDALCYHSRSEVWWRYQHHNQLLRVLIKFCSVRLGCKCGWLDNQVPFLPSSIFRKSRGLNTPSSRFF